LAERFKFILVPEGDDCDLWIIIGWGGKKKPHSRGHPRLDCGGILLIYGWFMRNTLGASMKALFTVLVWGASFVAIKIGLKYVPPVTLVWMRFAIGVIILGMAVGFRHQFTLPKPKDWFYFALLGFLGITFHQWLQSTGLVTSQATTTGWIVASMPIFIAILGWLVLKEKLIWLQIMGILLAAIGVLLVVTHGSLISLVSGKFGSPGDILILISAPNWAVFTILSRRGLKTYPAALMMLFVMAFGWLFSTILFVAGRGWESMHHIATEGWLALGFFRCNLLRSGIHFLVRCPQSITSRSGWDFSLYRADGDGGHLFLSAERKNNPG